MSNVAARTLIINECLAEQSMDEQPQTDRAILSAADALSPEGLAEELARRGILISADTLRQKAVALGACHILGDAMLLMPEDVDAILRHGKQHPPLATRSVGRPAAASVKQRAGPEELQPVAVYSPATLARHWDCSERHIRNMIATGELPSFRAGGKLLRIRAEDVSNAELSNDVHTAPVQSPLSSPTQPVAASIKKRRKPAARLDRRY